MSRRLSEHLRWKAAQVYDEYGAYIAIVDRSGQVMDNMAVTYEQNPDFAKTLNGKDVYEALLTIIGGDAFVGCSSLTSMTIPDSVTAIGANPFPRSGLQSIMFRYEDKQAVMNENTLAGRLQRLVEMLRRECQVMKIEKEIADKVNESMDKNQRDYYLHEQLHVISDELGEGDDTHAEADEYRRKITALHLAEDSEKKLLKEVDRLSKMQGSNQEATVIRTYLDTCLDLPWNSYTEDDLDINRAQQILDRDHYGLKKVKDRILETLAVRKLAPDVKAQIICLVGPPGVGKTSIARSIAESLGRKYVRISLGGVRDEAEIRGHRRTYIGAMPGKIISAMITAKSSNPLMLLDEIDKLAGDFRGDPAAALLEALDPEQNSTFNDHFLDIPFDLSHVLFITTANDLGSIPGPLRDRMDVIELPSYTRVEKYNIARKHLLPKQLKACGLTGKVTLSQSALYGIIDGYTREAGVRNLERTITSVLRKCARKIASGEAETVSVTGSMLEDLLGPRFVKPDFLNRTNAVGIANGLAWTSVGGETLPIEVQVIDNGSGKITVTGSLGDVMKESAQLAVTWVRVHALEYGIDPERLKKCDLHIHAPEGAVPKDGPSAGAAAGLVQAALQSTVVSSNRIYGIGVCLPGLIDSEAGKLLAHRQFGWYDKDIVSDLRLLTGYTGPITIENDASSRALAAQLFLRDQLKEVPSFFYLYVSIGIASPFVRNDFSLSSSPVGAGELGLRCLWSQRT